MLQSALIVGSIKRIDEISQRVDVLENGSTILVEETKMPESISGTSTAPQIVEVTTQLEDDPDPLSNVSTDDYIETVGKSIGGNMVLPNIVSDRKLCTDYRFYNIPGTPHYRMQQAAYTDELGCRRYGESYIVGLGSAYADRLGEVFEVELDTGKVFKIITGDMKADCDTDITNRYTPCFNYNNEECANILEFVIDKETLSKEAYRWGGVDYYKEFKGNIVRMTYLGRDTSADWDIYT